MKIKEAKYLEEISNELEIQDIRLIPIVLYLLKEKNYFKSIEEIIRSTGYSRYLIKKAKDLIQIQIREYKRK